eukprot:SAG11_NODE_733_length_7467_cov_4.673453_4_plen_65_part_00
MCYRSTEVIRSHLFGSLSIDEAAECIQCHVAIYERQLTKLVILRSHLNMNAARCAATSHPFLAG